jgi:hypothetical protein
LTRNSKLGMKAFRISNRGKIIAPRRRGVQHALSTHVAAPKRRHRTGGLSP